MPKIALTRAALPRERKQEFWLPSPWGEGLGMRAQPFVRNELNNIFALLCPYNQTEHNCHH